MKKFQALTICVLLFCTTVLCAQTASADRDSLKMSVREYRAYVQHWFDWQWLQQDTTDLNYQVLECEREQQHLRKEINEVRMAGAEKDTVNAKLGKQVTGLTAQCTKLEKKVDRRGNLCLILMTVVSVMLGALFLK